MPSSSHPRRAARPVALASVLLVFFATFFGALPAAADPGDLLATFGTGGILTEHSGFQVEDAILHPTLGLIVAMYLPATGNSGRVRILRLNPHTGATIQTLSFLTVTEMWELRVVDDGQGGLVVGGSIEVSAQNWDLWIFRLDSDLVVDPGFGYRQVPFDLVTDGEDFLEDLAVLPDGRIVALAQVETTFGFQTGLAYLNPDGSLDATIQNGAFPDGLQLVPFALAGDVIPEALVVDSQGRIVVGGVWYEAGGDWELAFARMLGDGTADATFAGNGTTNFAFQDCLQCAPVHGVIVEDMAVLGDDVYVVVTVPALSATHVSVALLTDLGGVDGSFGGWRTQPLVAPAGSPDPGGPMVLARPSLAVDEERRGLVVGTLARDPAPGGLDYVGILRWNTSGELDAYFGNDGGDLYAGTSLSLFESHVVVRGVDPVSGLLSNVLVATSDTSVGTVTVVGAEGFPVDLFADGFESGGLVAWSAHVP